MSEASEKARAAMKAKIARMMSDPHDTVDASDYSPPDYLDAGAKTGMRPLSPRQFKSGGKVEGDKASNNGKRPRNKFDALINENFKDANEGRAGVKHVGGFRRGGEASGGWMKRGGYLLEGSAKDKKEDKAPAKKHHESVREWGYSPGDKIHDKQRSRDNLKTGGRAKGKTNINIIIGHGGGQPAPQAGLGPQAMPVRPPLPTPPAPPAGPPAMPMPMPMPTPMPRKSGGKVYGGQPHERGGEGRLERIKMYGRKPDC
jgi:hypothetical protein